MNGPDTPGAARDLATRPLTRSRAFWIGVTVGTPVSLLLLWLAVRNANLGDVRAALADARPGPVAAAVAAIAAVYALQAYRWRLIAATPGVRWRRFTEMVVEGVACNNVLPGRLGDLLRARWLGVEARVPAGRAFGTVVLDRGADLATLVGLLLVSSLAVAEAPWLRRVAAVALVGLVALAAVLAFAHRYTRTRARSRRRQRSLGRRLVRDTLEGLATPTTPARVAAVAALSLAAWSAWALAAWLVARAVSVELSPAEALFTCAAVNLGVAIPSSPGFVGTYQWLGVQTLALFGVGASEALAFSILAHAAWYVPTTLVGGAMLGVRGLRRLRRRGEATVSGRA